MKEGHKFAEDMSLSLEYTQPSCRRRDVDLAMRKLFGSRGYDVLMEKATISSSLNIVRTFKATVT